MTNYPTYEMNEIRSILSYRRMLGRENTNFRKNSLAN